MNDKLICRQCGDITTLEWIAHYNNEPCMFCGGYTYAKLDSWEGLSIVLDPSKGLEWQDPKPPN